MPSAIFNIVFSLFSLVLALPTGVLAATTTGSAPRYQLHLSFDLDQHRLIGKATIRLGAGEGIRLDLRRLEPSAIVLKMGEGSSQEIALPSAAELNIPPAPGNQEVVLAYRADMTNSPDNLIGPKGISLLHSWYPQPDRKVLFQFSATLPEGFQAISEADRFPLAVAGEIVSSTYPEPLTALHFVAGPYIHRSLPVRDGLKVHALFFPEDQDLAAAYLEAAAGYLRRFEADIGPYPYHHYAIVAGRQPTGLGLPTFSLFGQAVLRLPFIKDTSLGHEIVHSWFGNSVAVDYRQGNWCEGLTSYLADHAFRADRGEGAAYRKEVLINYHSYIKPASALPLAKFIGGDPGSDRAGRAVGYGRATMLFHELRQRIGPAAFRQGLRQLYGEYRGKEASWEDLRRIFAATAGADLDRFFHERLTRTDIADLSLEEVSQTANASGNLLSFRLRQGTDTAYDLLIPIRIETAAGPVEHIQRCTGQLTEVRIQLPRRPLFISIDPDYSLLRRLTPAEMPPTWSRLLGSTSKLAILPSPQAEGLYAPLLAQLRRDNWQIRYDGSVKNSELAAADLLFLGLHQQSSRSLFARPNHPETGFTLEMRPNPLATERVVALVSSSSAQETAAAARRLSHYGNYSFLHFVAGRIQRQELAASEAGIVNILEELPQGGATAPLKDFAAIAQALSSKDVVYIGEYHTAVADHLLQLRLIEAIHRLNPDLAIGMEMFPASSQAALDRYIFAEPPPTEAEFLKESRYFQVWSYDYRYFREILAFARQQRIAVLGLNLDHDIVSTVFHTGSTDQLKEDAKRRLPADRDLDMPGYRQRLQGIHQAHQEEQKFGTSAGFIQAQALWDETMAANIVSYRQRHPTTSLIVLAGAEHTRKDAGIPPRVARRLPLRQASVLNIASDSAPADLAEVADYFFLAPPVFLADPGKMGLVLEESPPGKPPALTIAAFSANSNGEKTGLRRGDILTEVNGHAIKELADARIALIDAKVGDQVKLTVKRPGADGTTTTAHFSLVLVPPGVQP